MTRPAHRLTGHGVPHLDHAERTAVGEYKAALRGKTEAERKKRAAEVGSERAYEAAKAAYERTWWRWEHARIALDAALMGDM